MASTLTADFATRREAEMAVERLVQEYGVERSAIRIAAAGPDNSAGEDRAGSDDESAEPTPEKRDDAALEGRIAVSVALENEALGRKVRDAFAEFGGEGSPIPG